MRWREQVLRAKAALGIAGGSRAFGPPLQVSLSLTNRCNIRCIHCWYHSPRLELPNLFGVRRARGAGQEPPAREDLETELSAEADTAKTADLVDEAAAMGIPSLQFDANGEVFLHPDAVELMGRARRNGIRCTTYTNGTLLTSETVDELVDMRFNDLCVTTLAGNAEDYEGTHPGAAGRMFDRAREGLLYLAERKRNKGTGLPRLRMQYTIVRQTIPGIADFVRFARDVGADLVSFLPLDDISDPALAELRPSGEEVARAKAELEEAALFLDAESIAHNVGSSLSVLWKQRDTSALYRAIPCYYGWLGMKVDLDGTVYPCCRCYESLGNAHAVGLAGVWFGEAYTRFRREALAIVRRRTPVAGCQCDSCSQPIANLKTFRALHPIRGLFLDVGAYAQDIE